MTKDQLLQKLENAWTDLLDSFAGLTDEQMVEAGVMGEWSVKDILGHISSWEEEGLKFLPVILEGKRPPRYSVTYGGIDAFNAQTLEANRQLPLAEVRRRFEATHRRLLGYVAEAPDEAIETETRFRRRLRFDTYRHYGEHAEMIRAWREGVGI